MFWGDDGLKAYRVRDIVSRVMKELCQKAPEAQGLPVYSGHSHFSIHRGEFTVIFSQPWGGATAFLSTMAVDLSASKDVPVVYFSFNLPKDVLTRRMLCLYSGVKFSIEKRDEDLPALTAAAGALSEAPLYVMDDHFDLDSLERSIRRVVREKKIQLVLLDTIDDVGFLYDADVRSFKKKRERVYARLKRLAASLNVAIVGVVKENDYLHAAVEKNGDGGVYPIFEVLRREGDIALFADSVAVLGPPDRGGVNGSIEMKSHRWLGRNHVCLVFDRLSLKYSFLGDDGL